MQFFRRQRLRSYAYGSGNRYTHIRPLRPNKETLYAPWGGRTHWVRTPESFETLTGALDYDHRTTGTLMDGLTVDMVEDAARQFWQGIKKGTA